MKISNFLKTFALFTALLGAISCQKTGTDVPILSIAAPLVDDQFTNGQDIRIKGEASDAEKLHALTIKITDDKTGAVLFTNAPTVHDLKSYAFDVTWKAKVSDWTDATLTVIAENHDDQQTVKTIKIKIWL